MQAALDAADGYIARRSADACLRPLSSTFARRARRVRARRSRTTSSKNFGIGGAITACEYLADRGLIGKASIATRLTRRSNVDVQELAFFYHRGTAGWSV